MFQQISRSQYHQLRDDSQTWKAIEHSLALATKADTLRGRSRALRQASQLIRKESARISREQLAAIFSKLDDEYGLFNLLPK